MENSPLALSSDSELSIQVMDQGNAGAASPDTLSLEEAVQEPNLGTAGQSTGPRVDIVLRRIFDEAQARQPNLDRREQEDDFSAPLAVDKSEALEESVGVLDADPAEAAAEFPGFVVDELLRYRQQMYRTDI